MEHAPPPAGADFYQLLPSREVLIGRQPLGSKLQLQLDPGLLPELEARAEVASLRRRRCELLRQQLDAERRAALQPVSSNLNAVEARASPNGPLRACSVSPVPLAWDPEGGRHYERCRPARQGAAAVRQRWREMEDERDEERWRLANITHHALPPGGAWQPPSLNLVPATAGSRPCSSGAPVAQPHTHGPQRRPAPPPHREACSTEAHAGAAGERGGDPDVWPAPSPKPRHALLDGRRPGSSIPGRKPATTGTFGCAAADSPSPNASRRAASAGWRGCVEAAERDADMWVWRRGSAACLEDPGGWAAACPASAAPAVCVLWGSGFGVQACWTGYGGEEWGSRGWHAPVECLCPCAYVAHTCPTGDQALGGRVSACHMCLRK
jgi:hypothetical protein